MHYKIGTSVVALTIALSSLTAQTAGAQTAAGAEPAAASPTADNANDIVVTAQRRAEGAQKVPISLTALNSEALTTSGVSTVRDLQRVVPGLSVQRSVQAANTRIAIRGIGSSGNTAIEPSVGAFVDGIYIPRPGSLLAGLNDVSSVEVLRGPQGTLFGRNASMGAISFRTNLPKDEFGIDAGAEYGSYNRRRSNLVINTPLGEQAAFRIAGLYDETDGYGINDLTGSKIGHSRLASVRATMRVNLSDNLTWTGRADYQSLKGDGQSVVTVLGSSVTPTEAANFATAMGGTTPYLNRTYSRHVNQLSGGSSNDQQWGVSSEFELHMGEYSLKLLSSFRDWQSRQAEEDATTTPIGLFGRNASFGSTSHSQELQLASPDTLLDGKLSFIAGLYYFHEDYQIGEVLDLGAGYCNAVIARAAPARLAACRAGPLKGASTYAFDQSTDSLAAFGQSTFKLTDSISLTGGVRYSHDSKDADLSSIIYNSANIARAADSVSGLKFRGGKVTYRLNATWTPVHDVMFFATYATGYKSGGFDAGNGSTLGAARRVFRPETTTNYELGVKSQFLDRKVTANFTLFRTDINDFQLRAYDGIAFSVQNAGSIRQQGVEFELTARPFKGFQIGVTGTRLDSEYTDFKTAPALPAFTGTQDLTGRRAPTSPKWQGVASASYTGALTDSLNWSLSGNYAYQTASDLGQNGDGNPQGIQPAYGLLGFRASLSANDESWEVYVAGDNVTDKGYCNMIYSQPFAKQMGLTDPVTGGAIQRCILGDPASFRVGAKIKFH